MEQELPPNSDDVQTPVVVGLIEASLDQVNDGRVLAAYLEAHGERCLVRQMTSVTSAVAAEQLTSTGARSFFVAAGRENLKAVLGAVKMLGTSVSVVLFGRELSDADLRRKIPAGATDDVLVGEPWDQALSRLRSQRSGAAARAPASPRAPRRGLDDLPTGRYGLGEPQVAEIVPVHTSRSSPHVCLFSAERAWEQPVRRRSAGAIVEELTYLVEACGARHFAFTDLVANTDSDALLEVAEGILARRLELRWHARIWPDPRLDLAAVRLLRQSGCRNLELQVYSGSAGLNQALLTGVDPEVAASLVRNCTVEGIRAHARLVLGLPGETDEDRTETLAWVSRTRDLLYQVALDPCLIREGAPLRRSSPPEPGDPPGSGLVFPAQDPQRCWHDGADNNESRRRTWRREADTWIDHLDLWRAGSSEAYVGALGRGVRQRLAAAVLPAISSSPQWRGRHLVLAGILNGREAFCGPDQAHLDLVGMHGDVALGILDQLAQLGTRAVVMGVINESGEDLLSHPDLEQLLERASEVGLEVEVKTSLHGATPERLRSVAALAQAVRFEETTPADLKRLERWVPVIAAARLDAERAGPRLRLRSSLGSTSRGLAEVVSLAASWGINELTVMVDRFEDKLDPAGRAGARAALLDLLERTALLDGPVQAPLERQLLAGQEPLLVTGAGWPPGFQLDLGSRTGEGEVRGRCPAGVEAGAPSRHPADPDGRYLSFDLRTCRGCELLAACPVDRVDGRVRLPMLRLRGCAELLTDLAQEDCGLGRLTGWVDQQPCLAGWDALRIDRHGSVFVCAACGTEPLGNARDGSLAELWYGAKLNEFRRMSHGAAKVMPHMDRTHCRFHCPEPLRFRELLQRLERLTPDERRALEQVCGEDRRGSSG